MRFQPPNLFSKLSYSRLKDPYKQARMAKEIERTQQERASAYKEAEIINRTFRSMVLVKQIPYPSRVLNSSGSFSSLKRLLDRDSKPGG